MCPLYTRVTPIL